jgi:hypothetical protein
VYILGIFNNIKKQHWAREVFNLAYYTNYTWSFGQFLIFSSQHLSRLKSIENNKKNALKLIIEKHCAMA